MFKSLKQGTSSHGGGDTVIAKTIYESMFFDKDP
jgi:hypothetical protein